MLESVTSSTKKKRAFKKSQLPQRKFSGGGGLRVTNKGER